MMTSQPTSRFIILGLSLAPLLFFGCASRQLVSLDNRYEKTRLPVHFDGNENEDENFASLTVGARKKETLRFLDKDSGSISIRNAAYSVDGSILLENGISHYGLALGFSPADHGLARLGAFWGLSQSFGSLLWSMTAGVFLNVNFNSAQYIDSDWDWFSETETPGSSYGGIGHLELPVRAGIAYDTHKGFSPFMNYSASLIGIGIDQAGKTLVAQELATGALWEVVPGHTLQVEASVMTTGVAEPALSGDTHTALLSGVRVTYVKKL